VNSHNTEKPVKNAPTGISAVSKRVRIVATDFVDAPPLTVVDDDNLGGDPYNSTGRHVIIKSRLDSED